MNRMPFRAKRACRAEWCSEPYRTLAKGRIFLDEGADASTQDVI
jgi:hypothetical protein